MIQALDGMPDESASRRSEVSPMRDSEAPKRPTIQVRVECTLHPGSIDYVECELLSSGTAVVTATKLRNARERLCPKPATCRCVLSFGPNRTRKGLTSELYVEPAFRFAYGIEGESEPRTGLAFSRGEAVQTAKANVRSNLESQPCISVIQLMYEAAFPQRPGVPRVIYLGKWEADTGQWFDYVHPANPEGFPLPRTQLPATVEYTGREFPQLRTALEAVIPFGNDPGDAK